MAAAPFRAYRCVFARVRDVIAVVGAISFQRDWCDFGVYLWALRTQALHFSSLIALLACCRSNYISMRCV
jgi:hypothetical protein